MLTSISSPHLGQVPSVPAKSESSTVTLIPAIIESPDNYRQGQDLDKIYLLRQGQDLDKDGPCL